MTGSVLVLGAGTAGSVLTRRLLDAGLTVTLVEAGGMDANPAIHDMARGREVWLGKEDWGWFSAPQSRALGRRLQVPRGKVVGGSGQLNGTIWVRGTAWDYDGWAAEGNTGWDWASIEPVFERMEREFMDRVWPELAPIQTSIIDAALDYGLPYNEDYNHGDQVGVSRMQLGLRDGKRWSTWAAYMRPVLDHPGLTLMTETVTDRLAFEGGRVIGAWVIRNGQRELVRGDQVVLAAGALASPMILLRSGIGPARQLRSLGVAMVADVPGVGKNLQDHFLVPVIFGTRKREVEPLEPGQPAPMTHWFSKTDPALPVPNTQPINFSVPFYYDDAMTGPASGFTLHAGLIRPQSAGEVRIESLDPMAAPVIDFNLFADEADLHALVASVRECRDVGSRAPLREEWGAYEVLPATGADDSDGAIASWVRRAVNTYHHQAGTCRMGVNEDAVVSPRLEVYGVEGLRVADASVMPWVTTGNTNAPTAMIAERVAEFLVG